MLLSNRFGPEPDPSHPLASQQALIVGVAGVTGLLQPAALTYLLLYAVLGVSKSLSRALSWQCWRLVSAASYDVYLLHPMVMYGVWSALPPGSWFALPNPSPLRFVAVTGAVLGGSLVLARAHSLFWRLVLRKLL
jgi:peptidoglycan/LPS O-acetylase OafA/YrhL